MISKQIKLDLNSCIKDLAFDVKVENDIPTAYVSFTNVYNKTMSAIKFKGKGYNSFGDVVKINNNDSFLVVLQDLSVEYEGCVKDLKFTLPNSEIRRIELTESQYCFTDGTVITYNEPNYIEYELEEYDQNNEEEALILASLREVNPAIVNKPLSLDRGWVCACGKFNLINDDTCIKCGLEKINAFQYKNTEVLDSLIAEHKEKEIERKIKAEETKKKNTIKYSIIGVVVFAFLCLIINAIVLNSRVTYSSVEEMRKAMQGTWTHDGLWQVEIDGDKGIQRYSDSEHEFDGTITWNPGRGYFVFMGNKFIVKSSYTLMVGKYDYSKGGTLKSSSKYSSSSSESMYTAIKISNLKFESNSSYEVCTGSVTNNGKRTYSYVKVKGAFKDSSGKVVDTDWTYAVGSEGLSPGESKTFRLSVPRNSAISSINVTLMD